MPNLTIGKTNNKSSFVAELTSAMIRITETLHVSYPAGYAEKLIKKYSGKIDHPRVIERICVAHPRISLHPKFYKLIDRILAKKQ